MGRVVGELRITAAGVAVRGRARIQEAVLHLADAVVVVVGDVDGAIVVYLHVVGIEEQGARGRTAITAGAPTSCPHDGGDDAARIDLSYLIAECVGDVHVPRTVHGHAVGEVKLCDRGSPSVATRSLGAIACYDGDEAVDVDPLDLLVVPVGEVDVAHEIEVEARGLVES